MYWLESLWKEATSKMEVSTRDLTLTCMYLRELWYEVINRNRVRKRFYVWLLW